MYPKVSKCLLLFLTCLVSISLSRAQDGHYWSENYGNKSMLLSGTVNASVTDLGAVFYNPARLGLIENPAFVINAKVYELSKLSIKNGFDEGVDLNKSNFGGAPSLAAGTFRLPFLEGHKFAYSFLKRQRTKFDVTSRIEKAGDLIDGLPGEETMNGKLDVNTGYDEEWVGLTWAPPVTENISVGLSTFLTALNKASSMGVGLHALNNENRTAYYADKRRYSFNAYGILWKLGFAADLSWLKLGLTVTTPRINAFKNGSTLYEQYRSGLDSVQGSNNEDIYVFNEQSDLNVKYVSPWAIGFGIAVPFNHGVVHLSGEWYDRIDNYVIMRSDPFVGQSTGDSISFVLNEELSSVINYGIGLEWNFSEQISAFASLATDFSAVPEEVDRFSDLTTTVNNSILQADFYQFGGGLSINVPAVEITAGATYRGGSKNFRNTIDFPDEGDDGSQINISTLKYSQWRFILGFSFPFGDRLVKNLVGD